MQERGQKGNVQLGPMPSKALVLRLLSEGLEEPGHPPTLPSGKLRGQPGLLVALGAPSLTLGLSPAPQLSYGTRDRQSNRWRPRLGAWLGALLSPHLVPHLELCVPKTITAGGGLACQPTGWTGIMETSPVPDIPLWAQRKRGKGRFRRAPTLRVCILSLCSSLVPQLFPGAPSLPACQVLRGVLESEQRTKQKQSQPLTHIVIPGKSFSLPVSQYPL